MEGRGYRVPFRGAGIGAARDLRSIGAGSVPGAGARPMAGVQGAPGPGRPGGQAGRG